MNCEKVPGVRRALRGNFEPVRRKKTGTDMFGVNSASHGESSALRNALCQKNESENRPSTAEIRAFLTSLKMRPVTEREFLCRLLKRAAARARTMDSAVHLAESPHLK